MLAVLATFASIYMPQFNNMLLILVSVLGLVHLILVHSLPHTQTSGFGATLLVPEVVTGIQPRAKRPWRGPP